MKRWSLKNGHLVHVDGRTGDAGIPVSLVVKASRKLKADQKYPLGVLLDNLYATLPGGKAESATEAQAELNTVLDHYLGEEQVIAEWTMILFPNIK